VRKLEVSLHIVCLISIRKDDYAFFLEPVNPEKVPGYMDVIKKPMDFGTMSEKVAKSKYKTLDEFSVRSSTSFRKKNFKVEHTLRTIFALSYPTPKRSTHQAQYITPKPSELKLGHLTTYQKLLPASSNTRLTGTLRSIATKMSMSTLMRRAHQEGQAPDLIRLCVVPRL
jgi:Bromodomain